MTVWTRTLCRLLAALMIWTPWQIAQAGMIGAGDNAAVLSTISRADVVRELQSFGIDPALAAERVAAMSDQELRSLADQHAGGNAAGIALAILIVWGVWYFFYRKKPS